jgi:hypothetical protein
LVVARITPPSPTAKHVVGPGQLTPSNEPLTPDVWSDQPPVFIARIVPDEPTASHMLVVGQLIADSVLVVTPGPWLNQVRPPSRLFTIVPSLPTAKQDVELGQLTPYRVLAVPDF